MMIFLLDEETAFFKVGFLDVLLNSGKISAKKVPKKVSNQNYQG